MATIHLPRRQNVFSLPPLRHQNGNGLLHIPRIGFRVLNKDDKSMVVCICNRLTDAMIAAAVANGARNQADIFRRYHLRRGCSSCSVRIAEAIDRAQHGAPIQPAE